MHKQNHNPPGLNKKNQYTTNNNVNSQFNSTSVNDVNVSTVVNVINNVPNQKNYILGTKYNDVLTGTDYTDYIYGKNGNDVITGNKATDYLYGGKGRNTYYTKDKEVDFIYITSDSRNTFDLKRADVIKSADSIDRIDILGVSASKVKVKRVQYISTGFNNVEVIGIFAKGRLEAVYTGGDLSLHQVENMII